MENSNYMLSVFENHVIECPHQWTNLGSNVIEKIKHISRFIIEKDFYMYVMIKICGTFYKLNRSMKMVTVSYECNTITTRW